ncbi:PIG-X / PBN1 [Phytophthora infestans]|uniref:PIG-X / PBN1 n=1 Tax=Phytophthora infestans TaxID=4787 RepID=A0A833S028_PHYIN|nr:PIG-X / PBN1 [Phytophthora infestans]KAF4128681.1 PIG-X / PBN1 [Phytophthora infestans]
MRLWTALLGIFAGGLSVEAASHATFAVWPQYIDTVVSLSVNADGASAIQTSHGGTLKTFNMKTDTKAKIHLDPLVEAFEITWSIATDTQSSTFDHFLATSSRFDGINAVGIHLRAKLREEASWGAINETHHERIENNVRGLLQNVVPSFEILPYLSKGFLAKSFCKFHTWKTSNPLDAESPSLCFSSSFPISSQSDGTSFYNVIIRGSSEGFASFGKSVTERALFGAQLPFRKSQDEARLAVVTFRRSLNSTTIEAEYMVAWIATPSSSEETFKAALAVDQSGSDVLVVTSIGSDLDVDELELAWLQRDGKRVAPSSPRSVLEVRSPKTNVAASLQAAIAGEGFHRRYVLDVKVLDSKICSGNADNKSILARVPISNTAYIDLDEIRRMERFSELKLLSFTKHIEIERPSPVSSQHVVGLEFTMPSTNQVHVEFPIHFRYQAPSQSELYRQALVIAPDIFLYCGDGDRSPKRKLEPTDDEDIQNHFQTWGLFDHSDSPWLRLAAKSPLPVLDVLTPVGYLPSAWLVSSTTMLFAILGAATLVWMSVGVTKTTQRASWEVKSD